MLAFLAIAVLGLILAPFVAVQIQERIFRHQAEQLLADVRSLMLHRSNPAEFAAVAKRWHQDGPSCTEQHCWLETGRDYPSFEGINYCEEPTDWRSLWLRLFRTYGGRLAWIRAHAGMEHGTVTFATFQISMENFSRPNDAHLYYCTNRPEGLEGVLTGEAVAISHFSLRDDWEGLTLHPDYLIQVRPPRQGDSPPVTILSESGPHADLAAVARLANFDLSCLTRLIPCRQPADLMPEAAEQWAKEAPQLAEVRKRQVCSPDMLALMARDAGRAGVVEVTRSRTEHHAYWGFGPDLVVRMVQDLKPASDWEIGEIHELVMVDAYTDRAGAFLPAEVGPGNHFIMLAESELYYRWVITYRCGILPLTPANLSLVQNAIAGNLPPAKP
jgi:hypothetical protein